MIPSHGDMEVRIDLAAGAKIHQGSCSFSDRSIRVW